MENTATSHAAPLAGRELAEAAARAAGVYDPGLTTAALAAAVLRHVAGQAAPRSAIADGGSAPKRAGTKWEGVIVDYARAAGLDWDRAPLRGRRDLLDVTGCVPDGWLVGAKAVSVGVSPLEKLPSAMDQCHRAMASLAARGPHEDVIPWQVFQRRGVHPGRAYAVTEYDWMLRICQLRRDAWGAR